MSNYTITPIIPGVRPQDNPNYDGITFVYIFTEILAPFIQPAPQGNVTIVVANSQGFVPGMTIVIESAGYYQVVSTEALDRMTIQNFGTNYNLPPGVTIQPGKITTTSLPGPPGGTGPVGPTGPQGVQGNPGPPLNPLGTVSSSSALPSTGNNVGDLWIAVDTGHGWSWGATNAWIDLGMWQGPEGPAGIQGVQGNPGPVGLTGPAGSTGPQGPVGNPGPVGSTGPQGPQGIQGPAGIGLNMKGTVPTHTSLPATGNQPNDTYTALDTGHAWTWNGTTWIDIGLIQGPAGQQGPTGPAGTAATIAVGTTSTTAPGTACAVSDTGSPSAAVFNFSISRGSKWFQGNGPPPATISGALPGDYYLDNVAADVYIVS